MSTASVEVTPKQQCADHCLLDPAPDLSLKILPASYLCIFIKKTDSKSITKGKL